jgi:hypothetical protein
MVNNIARKEAKQTQANYRSSYRLFAAILGRTFEEFGWIGAALYHEIGNYGVKWAVDSGRA